ncbi:MAG: hypothetical protein CVU79_12940 [Elusimicrobia bacterium HGW-Elusimicrobia-3]|nr:MAG: hypothetical protein CVU79_12940 [Elusimicrobia bacterium HGW-Elusimicrobia-3]
MKDSQGRGQGKHGGRFHAERAEQQAGGGGQAGQCGGPPGVKEREEQAREEEEGAEQMGAEYDYMYGLRRGRVYGEGQGPEQRSGR